MREDLGSSCDEAHIPRKEMVRSVKTRWNSLAEAIKRALDLRAALEKFFNLAKYGKGRTDLSNNISIWAPVCNLLRAR